VLGVVVPVGVVAALVGAATTGVTEAASGSAPIVSSTTGVFANGSAAGFVVFASAGGCMV
jgi:hypothetical protein